MSRKSRCLLACMWSSSSSAFSAAFLFLMTSSSTNKIMDEFCRLTLKMQQCVKCQPFILKAHCMGTLYRHFGSSSDCFTCVAVSHLACFPVSESMWAEVENQVIVVWKCPEPQVNQITELIHCFDVCICSAAMRM